jgi:riboflavin kinase/FMN adenylyltransferase
MECRPIIHRGGRPLREGLRRYATLGGLASIPPLVIPPLSPIPTPFVAASSGRWSPASPGCAVTVGNFDGVHLGHAAIVRQVCMAARRLDVPAVAFTFDPHPAAVVRPESAPAPLTTPARRAALLRSLGVDAVLVQPTDRLLVSLPAEGFYAEILRGRLHARAIVEGADFRFGANRTGDIRLLESLCSRDGMTLETVAAVMADGLPVSSSRLRGLIVAGAVREASLLMTSPYRLTGTVVEGARRGGTIGFPTANLSGIATLLPAAGVYAARVTVPDGSIHPAAVHIGPNISFGETRISIEAHLIGYSGMLYGSTLDVDFLDRLRDTQRFDSIDALKAQLSADVARALEVVGSLPDESRIIV